MTADVIVVLGGGTASYSSCNAFLLTRSWTSSSSSFKYHSFQDGWRMEPDTAGWWRVLPPQESHISQGRRERIRKKGWEKEKRKKRGSQDNSLVHQRQAARFCGQNSAGQQKQTMSLLFRSIDWTRKRRNISSSSSRRPASSSSSSSFVLIAPAIWTKGARRDTTRKAPPSV